MKTFGLYASWAFVAGVVLYAAVHPSAGVIYTSPGVAISLGMIGLGLCLQARQNAQATRQSEEPAVRPAEVQVSRSPRAGRR